MKIHAGRFKGISVKVKTHLWRKPSLTGRRTPFLSGSIRPTTDKVREWIFQFLDHELSREGRLVPYLGLTLQDTGFLDLFSGSGIMGIEALSRGCRFAAFVDDSTCDLIRRNLYRVGHAAKSSPLENVQTKIIKDDVVKFLRRRHPARLRFHIIYADPPYNYDQYPQLLRSIAAAGLFEDGGLFVLESGKHANFPFSSHSTLPIVREKRFGETQITIFKKGAL